MKTYHYCVATAAPRYLLAFLKPEKICISKSINFISSIHPSFACSSVRLFFLLMSIHPSLQVMYKGSIYQTTALLLKIFLFQFRGACELGFMSYCPNKHPTSFMVHHFVHTPSITYKPCTGYLQLYYILNRLSTSKDATFPDERSTTVTTYNLLSHTIPLSHIVNLMCVSYS